MMKLLLNVLFVLVSHNPKDFLPNTTISISQEALQQIVVESRPIKGAKKWKIRWKKVFRPIYIFKKRVAFWLGIFSGVLLVMSLLALLAQRYNYEWSWTSVNKDDTYLLALTYLVSAFVVLLLLLWIPIVWLYRIIQELRWKKRFNRCFRG